MGAAAIAAGGIGAAGGLYSAYAQGEAGAGQASYFGYLADTARRNSKLAEAEGLSERKNINAQVLSEQQGLTRKVNATVGVQKAAVVGGVGAGSRSAQQIIGDTLNKANLDEMALRMTADARSRNAEVGAKMGALNYTSQAGGFDLSGINARSTARMGQVSSLIGGAGSVANAWYRNPWNSRPEYQ